MSPNEFLRYCYASSIESPSGCWLWLGATNRDGYASHPHGLVHRLVFEAVHGRKADTVRHKCDVRQCVNPAHLEEGTQADNVRDMVQRQRQARGSQLSPLTSEQVTEYRQRHASGKVTCRQLASEAGISVQAMHAILTRKTWRHVP